MRGSLGRGAKEKEKRRESDLFSALSDNSKSFFVNVFSGPQGDNIDLFLF